MTSNSQPLMNKDAPSIAQRGDGQAPASELERAKFQRLLDRIDELCQHISAVDSAVAMLGQNGKQGSSLVADGIPPEYLEQFKVLADRVEQQSRKDGELRTQIFGKFDQLATIINQVEVAR